MKFLYDFFPILLFFAAYKIWDIYVATGVAIVASIVQVAGSWYKKRRIENTHWITLGSVVLLGGATLWLRDERFIQWKPTIVYWLFAAGFLGTQFIGNKTLIERMMGHAINVDPPIWQRLNVAWTLFFVAMGFANLYVAYSFDTDTWVNFKLFGLMGLMLLFVLLQGLYLARYIKNAPEDAANNDK